MQGYEPSSSLHRHGLLGKIVREHEKRGDPEKGKEKDYFQTQDSMGTS